MHWYASAFICNTKLMEPKRLITGSRLRLIAGFLPQILKCKKCKHFCLIINGQQTKNFNRSLDLRKLESQKWAVIVGVLFKMSTSFIAVGKLMCSKIKVIPANQGKLPVISPKYYWMHAYTYYANAKTRIKDWLVVVKGVKSLSESHRQLQFVLHRGSR